MKTACITGGSSGLGLEITKCLLKKGYVVYVYDKVDHPNSNENLKHFKIDLSKEKPKPLNIKFDVIISNLGTFGGLKKFEEIEWKEIETTIDLNVILPLYILKHFSSKKFVFINSVLSQNGFPSISLYCSCKSFISILNSSIRREGVDTLIVYPYKIRTKLFADIKDFFSLEPSYVAERIVKGIERNEKEIYLPFLFRYTYFIPMLFLWLQDIIICYISKVFTKKNE